MSSLTSKFLCGWLFTGIRLPSSVTSALSGCTIAVQELPRPSTPNFKILMRDGAMTIVTVLPCPSQTAPQSRFWWGMVLWPLLLFCHALRGLLLNFFHLYIVRLLSYHPFVSPSAKISIFYANSRSLLPNVDELRLLAGTTTPDLIAITETWLDSTISTSEVAITSYQLFRRDRSRHGGGICLYISDALQILRKSCHECLEFMYAEIVTDMGLLFVGVHYCLESLMGRFYPTCPWSHSWEDFTPASLSNSYWCKIFLWVIIIIHWERILPITFDLM